MAPIYLFKPCLKCLNENYHSRIKDHINNPPEKQDFQRVSHNLANFIKLKDDSKTGSVANPKRYQIHHIEDTPENYRKSAGAATKRGSSSKRDDDDVGQPRHAKEMPTIRRLPNEPDEDYIRRVNRITRESIKESQFEAKYGVSVVRNGKTGEITLRKQPRDELMLQMKAAKKTQAAEAAGKKVRPAAATTKLSDADRKTLVKEMMSKKKKDRIAAQPRPEYQRDEVKFGEVVHAPPTLAVPRRAKKAETVARVRGKSE